MGHCAIKIEGLWKAYQVGEQQADPFPTMYEMLAAAIHSPWRVLRRRKQRSADAQPFWALRDINFEVAQGQVVGIIGRNGAGKSTLLKILSRITAPTRGRVAVRGRLASLLEVGTGFHPELSGRENIFVNGAILGMSRSEVVRKFDEIVQFAEIEGFLDTPVKRYSSGMYVRLAFAVAAHLEPDILVVDEVLAVGDAQFQRKCLAKIENVAGHGRTVLFVSHNMAAVQALCPTALLLDKGAVQFHGPTAQTLNRYAASGQAVTSRSWQAQTIDPRLRLAITQVESSLGGQQPQMQLTLDIRLNSTAAHKTCFLAVDILDAIGGPIMQALPRLDGFISSERPEHRLRLTIELPPLIPGLYYASIWVGPHNSETMDFVRNAISFEIGEPPTPGRTFPYTADHGYIVPGSKVVQVSNPNTERSPIDAIPSH
jgi:lipopolysaccharide transport system ATP-binding protein